MQYEAKVYMTQQIDGEVFVYASLENMRCREFGWFKLEPVDMETEEKIEATYPSEQGQRGNA